MNWLLDLTPDEWNAVRLSIKVATVAMLFSLPPGILIALLLARGKFWGKTLVNGIVLLPLILPPVVTGYLLLLSFGRRGPIGAFLYEHFGIVFSFRWTGAALACAVMAFPLLVRSIRLSIEAVDRRLEDAAGTLGANPLWVFTFVTLPLILPGIIAGMILRFASDGRLTAFFGRSGSGKTSLINIIAGVVRPDRGRIVLDDTTLVDTDRGVFVPKFRRCVGYVFQEGRLFPHLTVRQNLLFGRWFATRRARAGEVEHVIDLLGIGDLLARRPANLSGGEKQRRAIGRAPLAQPRPLALDQPLA